MMAGQTINDRLLAARHSIAGQGLAKSVCKATTEEMIAPKKKHLDYLVHCTNEPNVSIPQLANLLVERTQNANWVVVYKALLTVHHLLAYGNERFTQYLASSTCTFQLSNFLDKSGVQGYDMSPFIRRYAKYLNEKALSYRTVAFDFCKVKRGKEEGSLRMMSAEKLLKTLPVLQAQLDSLLEFDCSANDLTNGVVNMCFMLLFRDLIRLFACYNDGIINLLEKYFDMNKKNCRDALDLYKKFLIRMDRVGEFLKVAENMGIDKGDIPDLTRAPSSLLEALEGHLAALEGRPRSAPHTPPAPPANSTQKNMASAMGALSSTSTAFGNAAANDKNGLLIDDSLRRQALAEEEAAINQYKNKVASPTNSAANNPFLAAAPAQSQNIVDLFGPPLTENNGTKASDDLLSLGNPFADMFGGSASAPSSAPSAPSWNTSLSQNYQSGNFNQNGYQNPSDYHNPSSYQNLSGYHNEDLLGNSTPTSAPFASDSAPLWSNQAPTQGYVNENYLNTPGPTAAPPLWPVFNGPAQGRIPDIRNGSPAPAPAMWPANGANGAQSGFVSDDSFSNVFSNNDSAQPPPQPSKVLTGDLDSSLASLANNLTINKTAQAQKPMNWSSPKAAAKNNWTPQPMQATTGAGYRPMQQPMVMGMQQPMMGQPMRPPIPPQPAMNNQFS